ncbi:hypothetical protein MPCS_01344 [Candidatus Megaera polyxenophila]|nr:hypothetical protein MPCS_01344 [Candidatus Megaera polyxenophila]
MDNATEENINGLLKAVEEYIHDSEQIIDVLCRKLKENS